MRTSLIAFYHAWCRDIPISCKPGVAGSISGSPSLSDETLSWGPIFWEALKSDPLPVEPSGAPGYKQQDHKPTRPVLVIAKEHGHKQ